MTLAEDVLVQLRANGESLGDSVTFSLGDVQSMVAFVRNHLATCQEPIKRAGLNAKLREYKQDWTDCGFKALGFCYVVIANQLLHASSPQLFHSTEDFTLKYPKYDVDDAAEVGQALTVCNMMISALKILSAPQSKGALIEIVTKICEGSDGKVTTGGSKNKVSGEKYTLPAEAFYVKESGITPKSRGGSGEGAAEIVGAKDPTAQGGHSESESYSSSSSEGSKRSRADCDDDSMSTHESAGTKFACLSLASASPSPALSPHHFAAGSSSPPVLPVLASEPFSDAAEAGANAAAELSCDTDPFDPDSFEIDADLVGFGSDSESDSDQF